MRTLNIKSLSNNKGLTLIELMIVVAIVGILASLAGVAYFRQVKRAKISKLEQYAMDVGRGQEEFGSRHGIYYPVGVGNIKSTFSTDAEKWKRILGFNGVPPIGVEGFVYAGEAGEKCSGCTPEVSRLVNTNSSWWVVEFEQDMKPSSALKTRVLLSSTGQQPIILNEGE